jgi:hypothetical protein
MVLVIRYNEEELCSPKKMSEWFTQKECEVSKTKISGEGFSFDWSHMKLVNSLMFVVDVDDDAEFPAILFAYILSLSEKDTIVSLAEESFMGYDLIFEADLPKFVNELIKEE